MIKPRLQYEGVNVSDTMVPLQRVGAVQEEERKNKNKK